MGVCWRLSFHFCSCRKQIYLHFPTIHWPRTEKRQPSWFRTLEGSVGRHRARARQISLGWLLTKKAVWGECSGTSMLQVSEALHGSLKTLLVPRTVSGSLLSDNLSRSIHISSSYRHQMSLIKSTIKELSSISQHQHHHTNSLASWGFPSKRLSTRTPSKEHFQYRWWGRQSSLHLSHQLSESASQSSIPSSYHFGYFGLRWWKYFLSLISSGECARKCWRLEQGTRPQLCSCLGVFVSLSSVVPCSWCLLLTTKVAVGCMSKLQLPLIVWLPWIGCWFGTLNTLFLRCCLIHRAANLFSNTAFDHLSAGVVVFTDELD
jgi:hypothetical protein